MMETRSTLLVARMAAALVVVAAFAGCASTANRRTASPDAETRVMEAEAKRPVGRDGFPSDWELPKGAAAAPVSGGFPEGWEIPEEKAPKRAAEERSKVSTAASLSASLTASSTVSSEADLAKARIQVGKAEHLLGRLRGTGYQILVQDDIKTIDAGLEQARKALSAGNAPETRRLADDCARTLERARMRIESETRQPLRW